MTAETEAADQIRILIVDDHEMFAESLGRVLEREPGFTIVGIRGTIRDAVSIAKTTRPDVAILDWSLPDGDGADAIPRLLAVSDSTHILVLTGTGGDREVVAAVEAGCSGFVTKTNALKELVHAVRLTHAGEAYITPSMLVALLPKFSGTKRGIGTDLTSREREVLDLIATGLSNAAVGEQLYLSVHTIRNHVQNVLTKLGAHSKLEAVAIATREGLIRH